VYNNVILILQEGDENMTILKAFRLPAGLANRLSSLAKATHRSEKFYVAEALAHYLEDYADAQIAKDRFNDPKSRIISGKELRKRIGI
jgi:predicted DNA-binding protein